MSFTLVRQSQTPRDLLQLGTLTTADGINLPVPPCTRAVSICACGIPRAAPRVRAIATCVSSRDTSPPDATTAPEAESMSPAPSAEEPPPKLLETLVTPPVTPGATFLP